MKEKKISKKKLARISLYMLLSIVTFAVSIIILPLELFLFTSVLILITLRGIEKELSELDKKKYFSSVR